MTGLYSENEAWDDVVPIPLNEGGLYPLASIQYPERYEDAMSYLRAVMAADEKSERVLGLTETIIRLNPAHYTVWLYRAATLFALNKDLAEELKWLNDIAIRNLKNYQIWQHRQMVVDRLDSSDGEADFIARMFEQDAKNYHVWSYRHWLVKRFDLWDSGELEAIDKLLEKDVRNNSAWNHRYFVIFGREQETGKKVEADVAQREIRYAQDAIELAPQSQSSWNYLKGVLRHQKMPYATVKDFTARYAPLEQPDQVRSTHALDLLAEIHAQERSTAEAEQALDLLMQRFDPIRANYWSYRKTLLPESGVTA